jgi:hypothetical protein
MSKAKELLPWKWPDYQCDTFSKDTVTRALAWNGHFDRRPLAKLFHPLGIATWDDWRQGFATALLIRGSAGLWGRYVEESRHVNSLGMSYRINKAYDLNAKALIRRGNLWLAPFNHAVENPGSKIFEAFDLLLNEPDVYPAYDFFLSRAGLI